MIDWISDETNILLNPRMPQSDSDQITKKLAEFDLSSHLWLATSGTTGKYKCVALSKQAFLDSAQAVNEFLDLTANDVWIKALPNFHVGGLGIHARAYLTGSKMYSLQQWNPQHFTTLTHLHSATVSALVPTQLFDLVQENMHPPSSYRFTIIGGGALDRELFDRSWALGWNAVPSYGMTECASQVATARPGTYEDLLPLGHVSVKVDHDQFIMIKSSSLLTGYCYPGDKNFRFIDPKFDGWFKSDDKGDLQELSLKIHGRVHDMIKINGELVNLQQLQNILKVLILQNNVKEDLVLTALPSSRSGYEIHLLHVGEPDSLTQLKNDFNRSVLPYERIVSSHRVENIPRTPLGKVMFKEI